MESTLRNGRIVGPVAHVKDGGTRVDIPLGPCLIEPIDSERVVHDFVHRMTMAPA